MRGFSFFFSLLLAFQAYGQSLLQTAQEQYFDPSNTPKIGIEIELAGLTVDQTVGILQKVLGGTVVITLVNEAYIDPITGREEKYVVVEKILKGSSIGDVKVKPEDNNLTNANLKDEVAKTPLVEIVTDPITFDKVETLQKSLDELRKQGALGAAEGYAVAIQVNVEFGEGLAENMRVDELLALLRNYLKPENHENIAEELNVAEQRQKFLKDYTPGMMARILDLNYKPNWTEFYFDFMYRQSLELLNYKEAWTMPVEKAQALLRMELEKRGAKGFEAILPVVKWNYLRVSSLLMFLFPNDWLSEYLIKTTWFHKYPVVEFREANSDFNVLGRVKQFLGIVRRTQLVGDFTFAKEAAVSLREEVQSTSREARPGPVSCIAIFAL